jgi:hypothetical protein
MRDARESSGSRSNRPGGITHITSTQNISYNAHTHAPVDLVATSFDMIESLDDCGLRVTVRMRSNNVRQAHALTTRCLHNDNTQAHSDTVRRTHCCHQSDHCHHHCTHTRVSIISTYHHITTTPPSNNTHVISRCDSMLSDQERGATLRANGRKNCAQHVTQRTITSTCSSSPESLCSSRRADWSTTPTHSPNQH